MNENVMLMHALSAVVHLREHIDTGEPLDLVAAKSSLSDPSLRSWVDESLVLLPVRRDGKHPTEPAA